jgi:hypothetical protein
MIPQDFKCDELGSVRVILEIGTGLLEGQVGKGGRGGRKGVGQSEGQVCTAKLSY